MDDLGPKFWTWLIGITLAVGVGSILFFMLIGAAWARWGAIGALIFFGLVFAGVGYVYDRRHTHNWQ